MRPMWDDLQTKEKIGFSFMRRQAETNRDGKDSSSIVRRVRFVEFVWFVACLIVWFVACLIVWFVADCLVLMSLRFDLFDKLTDFILFFHSKATESDMVKAGINIRSDRFNPCLDNLAQRATATKEARRDYGKGN